jgi:hypothetical protein
MQSERREDEAPPAAPDLGRQNGAAPDRGNPSGHTPADAYEHRPRRSSDPAAAEKARPTDTGRHGA